MTEEKLVSTLLVLIPNRMDDTGEQLSMVMLYTVTKEIIDEQKLQTFSVPTPVPTLSATLELMSTHVSAAFNQKTPTVRFSLLTKPEYLTFKFFV